MATVITNPPAEAALTGVPHDDRTAGGLFLPHHDNSARIDIARLRATIILLDALINGAISASDVQALIDQSEIETASLLAAKADLIGGQIPESQIPAVAITDTFEVASQAAMLGLVAQRGDVAVRSDLNKSFILRATPAATLANWTELRTPTDAVLSVAGKFGAVVLVAADISDLATLLAAKAALTGATFTGAVSFTPSTLDVLTGGTKTVAYANGNRRRFELRSGANVFDVTGIPESGGDLELDLLYTAGTLAFTQTVRWKLGGGTESTALADTGVVLTAGVRYAVVIWNMGGVLYGAIS